MIEATFRAGAMAATGRPRRRVARARPARRRAIRVAAIARGADRKRAATAPTGLESQRGVHVVTATALDWTAFRNRGTNETTGSVCRSIETVTEGLEGSAPGPHLHSSPLDSLLQAGGPPSAGRSAAGSARTPRSSRPPPNACQRFDDRRTIRLRRLDAPDSGRHSSRFTRFYVSADTSAAPEGRSGRPHRSQGGERRPDDKAPSARARPARVSSPAHALLV